MGNKFHKNRANCIIHGLLRRDYLKLLEKKYKAKVFEKTGIAGIVLEGLSDDMEKFDIWIKAETGVPIVDAFMRELNETGFITFEGRRILSQFLIEELSVNWQIGAEYFQSKLIDYNPCSNWGNWNIVAGVGYDAKEDRYCNFVTKSKKLDPKGEYIRKWIPELSTVNNSFIHEPDKMSENEADKIKFALGEDYPKPVVDTDRWV
jgi:deoxyribodipyrimidine photo-lyase